MSNQNFFTFYGHNLGTICQNELLKLGVNKMIELQFIEFKGKKNAPGVTRTHGTWIRKPYFSCCINSRYNKDFNNLRCIIGIFFVPKMLANVR